MAKPKKEKEKEKDYIYTPEQENFVAYFIEQRLKDAQGAYQRAYPNCKSENAAGVGSSRLLRTPKIRELLKTRLEEATGRRKEHLEHQILELWYTRAFYDPAEILDENGCLVDTLEELKKKGLSVCIENIDIKPDKDGVEHYVYKLADRDKALEQLQKYIAMIKAPAAVNLNINANSGELTPEQEALYREQIDALKGAAT